MSEDPFTLLWELLYKFRNTTTALKRIQLEYNDADNHDITNLSD